MSRSAGLAALIMIIAGNPAYSQGQPPVSAEQVAENARKAYGPPPPEPACAPAQGDEIVVCARQEDNSQFRVKSSTELDPESEEALDDGLPRAPDVAGPGIFKGPATVGKLCIPGLQKCPPPPALMIDLSALPEAPEGSDADKVGKGEIPGR
ncbi:hypothetical protein [Allopontixanthobacter sp.]|uniref:hypothetical protein n=1 Tax=Allopontixanthobacter sp. TaxID=2906452 RepID=UPI002AB876BD|nr:hypothetical protein [Allopontixanthobacter sp.]MDZ4308867.1 hypothetical protein [Allopontixanthobacter sp.]